MSHSSDDEAQYKPPFRICVSKKRKQIVVLDWGRAPFHHSTSKKAWVPNGFQANTLLLNTRFIATTMVTARGEPTYQFRTQAVQGEFCKTPTSALQSVADKLGEAFLKKFRRGTNGALHIGVFGDEVQRVIRRVHKLSGDDEDGEAAAAAPLAAAKRRKTEEDEEDESMKIGVVEALLALKS